MRLLGLPTQESNPTVLSEPILGSELAKIVRETLSHRVGVDASDVAVVLAVNDFAEIALLLLPGRTVREEKKCCIATVSRLLEREP